MAVYASKYRDAARLRLATALNDLDNTGRFSDARLLGMVESAEEFLLGLGIPAQWYEREKKCFDSAVRAIIVREIAEPTTAINSTMGSTILIWDKLKNLPQLIAWQELCNRGTSGLNVAQTYRE